MALLLQFCLLYSLKTTKKRHLVYMSFDSCSIMRYCITCICQTQHNLWLIIRVAVLKWRPWSGSLPLFCQRENFISDINVCSPICKGFSNQWIFLKTPNIIHISLVIWKALKRLDVVLTELKSFYLNLYVFVSSLARAEGLYTVKKLNYASLLLKKKEEGITILKLYASLFEYLQ